MNTTRTIALESVIGILACIAALSSQNLAYAEDNQRVVLSESQVTTEKLKSMFDAAFLKTQVEKDGDLIVIQDGIKTYIKIDPTKKIISIFSIWPMKSKFSNAEKLEWINMLNHKLLFVRFYFVPKKGRLICDYQMSYDNGIQAYRIVDAYRRYIKVVRGAIYQMDPKDMVGVDKEKNSDLVAEGGGVWCIHETTP